MLRVQAYRPKPGGAPWVVTLHRLVWELTGRPDTPAIDHKDRDTLNNAEDNLRAATQAQNCCNRRKGRNNTSGVPGVAWDKTNSKWKVWIGKGGRQIHIGRFSSFADAVAARHTAAMKHHGKFAAIYQEKEASRENV